MPASSSSSTSPPTISVLCTRPERALLGGQREQQVELQLAVGRARPAARRAASAPRRPARSSVAYLRDERALRRPSRAGPPGRPRPGPRTPGRRRRRGSVVSTARNSPAVGGAGRRRRSALVSRSSALLSSPCAPSRSGSTPDEVALQQHAGRPRRAASASASLACSSRWAIWVCSTSPSTSTTAVDSASVLITTRSCSERRHDRAERLGQLGRPSWRSCATRGGPGPRAAARPSPVTAGHRRRSRRARPCTRRRARSARPRGAPGRARPSTAAAARARSPAGCRRRAGSPTPARAAPRG